MDFGLATFPTDYSAQPAELARAAEERGFESLWFPEHTHIPDSRQTPYPAGGDLPEIYWQLYDPFIALAAAAAVTEKLLVGTGICLVVERDPITTAKEVATIDRISNGRFLFGVGAGWNREEMANHGTDPKRRFGLMRERIEAMKAIWTTDTPEYHGDFVDFDPIRSWPKPVHAPHPPIFMGGSSDGALKRAVDLADCWMPNAETRMSMLPERVDKLQELAAEAGRDPLPVSFYAVKPDPESLRAYAAAGVSRAIFYLPSLPFAQLEGMLDQYAELAAGFEPG